MTINFAAPVRQHIDLAGEEFMHMKNVMLACLVAMITAFAPAESLAQFGGGIPGGGMRGNRNRPDSSAREQRPAIQENSPEQVEDRLGLLEEDLRLSAGQSAAWQSYADKVKALAADIGRERARDPLNAGPANSLQQIDHAVDIARNRLTALEDIAAAARTLYDNLTPQQKSVADPRLATIVSAATSGASGAASVRSGRPRSQP